MKESIDGYVYQSTVYLSGGAGMSIYQWSPDAAWLQEDRQRAEQAEDDAWQAVKVAAEAFAQSVSPLIWHWGDGEGGAVMNEVYQACLATGHERTDRTPRPNIRKKLPGRLRIKIMERDQYRCVQCGTHLNLAVDHIVPVVKGGTNEPENLQVLCTTCNSSKGVK